MMTTETSRKVQVILARLRQDLPQTKAGRQVREAMDRLLLALDAYRREAAAGG